MADNGLFENPTDELIDVINSELTALKQRQQEINGQIDQYEQMVRREEQRNTDLATAMRTMYDNFDTMPREDIRDRYDEAMDARFRLATMKGQLEQFKSNQSLIREERQLLSDVLSRVKGGIRIDEAEEEEETTNTGALNIVRIIQAQEDERRRLANQIHDGPAQLLTNFMLQAEIVQRLFDRDQETAKEELNNLKEAANQTFQRVRDFISDLRPMMLDDLGIIPTVRRYIENFSGKSDITVKETISGDESRRLEEYQEVLLFRGLQDLMAHARDYADATEMEIRMDIAESEAVLSLEDNGRNFDPETEMMEDHPDDPRAQGILTLREKIELVDGQVSVRGGSGEKTNVKITMPVNERVG